MIKKLNKLRSLAAVLLGLAAVFSVALNAQSSGPQQLVFAGLRSAARQGQFNAVRVDGAGNLYLLLDQKDGVRVLKTDASATTVLAQAALGAAGDVGLAMTLDPAGNVYVTGTSTSGSLMATSGAAFPSVVDSSANSFVAKFDAGLNVDFVTFGGSGRTAASAIAATADAVFITGLIYGNGLPVTPAGIMQAPVFGSSQNGFVERFSADGSMLSYATYLSGANGDTTPMALAVDASDDAYIGGFTTASGFPTVAALVPRSSAATTGFLLKLTPGGDGITFSTFIPGSGISAMAIDPAANNLLLTGTIALGAFPVANASMPLVNTDYQTLLRMPLDGSSVLSSTVVVPGTQSALAVGASGTAWMSGPTAVPLLSLPTLSEMGSSYAVRISSAGAQSTVDEAARFGGLATSHPDYASLPVMLGSVAVDGGGSAIFAGSATPTASASLLATESFDLPLSNAPTSALPSSVRDAVAPLSCTGSLCAGSAAYLARVTPTAGASLALSTDASPNIVLRNLGSLAATNLQITATGFTVASTCGVSLGAGSECSIVLGGNGPGSVTAQADNAVAQTSSIAAVPPTATANALVFSPKEIDFGIQTGTSAVRTQTVTVTNLGGTSQSFASALVGPAGVTPYTFSERGSTCVSAGDPSTKALAAGASCQIMLAFTASDDATQDGAAQAYWTIGNGNLLLTGYGQAAALNISSTTIDFGTQFYGGLRSARYLFLSNNSDATVAHSPLALSPGSPFTVTDRCATALNPHTVCTIQFDYQAAQSTSTDSITLNVDQGLTVLVTGETIPQPGANGSSANPSLSVTPGPITFATPVVVTDISSSTQTVTVSNTGGSAFTLALVLTGDFTEQSNCGSSLAGGTSCSVVLTFAPSQPGARQGLLAVTAGSGTTPVYVTLNGTGNAILPANNGTLGFGDVPLGQPTVQWYKIAQPFTTLTAAAYNTAYKVLLVEDLGYGPGQFPPTSFLAATTGSCHNCWLGVQFTPTATGPVSTLLRLASSLVGNSYDLTLTGSGVALGGVTLTPVVQDFGTVAINSVSAPTLFTLTNLTGSGVPITVTAPAISGDFSFSSAPSGGATCNGPLAENASCFLQVQFAPSATGQRTGTLTVGTSAGVMSSALTGFGAADPGIAFTPSALVFNNVPGPSATQQSITVTNTGSGTLQVGTPTNANTAFLVASNCAALATAASCTLTVNYAPASATITDAVQLPVTSLVGGSPVITTYSLPLAAAYTAASAGLEIVPGTADYGPAAVGSVSGTRQFTINNLTAKSVTVAMVMPRQFVLSGAPCTSLAPNASCTFSASFLPLTNGGITGTISAQGTPTDGSTAISGLGFVEGYGLGANAITITGNLSPGRILDFGQVPSGQSLPQVLTITNSSNGALSPAASAVTLRRITSQWPFLATTTCGAILAVNQSCTVTISYSPLNQVPPGTVTPVATNDAGTLTIESDALSGPDLIYLAGTATPTAVTAPSNTAPLVGFTTSQNSLTFPDTAIGFVSAPHAVMLANTGNTVLHIAGLTASTDFAVTGDSNCAVLVPGASCQLTVTFAPQISAQPGSARVGSIEISSDSSASLEFLSLIGTASPSTLLFQPGALNFGVSLVGSVTTLPLTITNAGTLAAVFNGVTTTGDYAVAGNCPAEGGSLAANANCTLQVSFTPTANGLRTGTVSIASSVSATPLTAVLTGTGVQSHLQISPTTLGFGNVAVGDSASLSFTLANTGTASITRIAFAASAGYAVTLPCSFTTLSPGASCSVTVAFRPMVAGASAGTLTITSSDPTSPDTVALSGTGVATNGVGGVTFSLTVNGGSSASQTVNQAHPATYTVTLTPLNGFNGTVVLACSDVTAAPNAACSMQPASLTLNGASQSATVTINTLTSAKVSVPDLFRGSRRTTTLCILLPAALFFWRFRRTLAKRPPSLLLALLCTTLMLLAGGCGSGGNLNVRFAPFGKYQYSVIATSSSGTPITQTVMLNLTIQ